jgi:hypothetical protein
VVRVERDDSDRLLVTVESAPGPAGCPMCGVIAHCYDRRVVELVDIRVSVGRPGSAGITAAGWCAVGQLRREHTSVADPVVEPVQPGGGPRRIVFELGRRSVVPVPSESEVYRELVRLV